jgi:hypothetical protein
MAPCPSIIAQSAQHFGIALPGSPLLIFNR